MSPYYTDMFAFIGVGIVAYKCAQLVMHAILHWQVARAEAVLLRILEEEKRNHERPRAQ